VVFVYEFSCGDVAGIGQRAVDVDVDVIAPHQAAGDGGQRWSIHYLPH